MAHTPFDGRPRRCDAPLNAALTFVRRPNSADIIVARKLKDLVRYGRFDRAFAIWTHEPRWNFEFKRPVPIAGIRNPVHIMNAYTGDIYADAFYYFPVHRPDFDDTMRAFVAKPRRAVMLASYRKNSSTLWNGADLDLYQYRQRLALHLKDRDFCDIYGRRWPYTVEIAGNSRQGNWHTSKFEILKDYAVNLAFENTIIPNYITEKIWDAVIGACLPVYHGAPTGIYRIFPENSFIEAEGKSVEQLGDEIIAMPKDEMAARYEACLRAYLAIFAEDRMLRSRLARSERTLRFLKKAIESHPVDRPAHPPSLWRRFAARFS